MPTKASFVIMQIRNLFTAGLPSNFITIPTSWIYLELITLYDHDDKSAIRIAYFHKGGSIGCVNTNWVLPFLFPMVIVDIPYLL